MTTESKRGGREPPVFNRVKSSFRKTTGDEGEAPAVEDDSTAYPSIAEAL
jgi:hypothetical protein